MTGAWQFCGDHNDEFDDSDSLEPDVYVPYQDYERLTDVWNFVISEPEIQAAFEIWKAEQRLKS